MQVLPLGDSPTELPAGSQNPLPATEMNHIKCPAQLSLQMTPALTTIWLQSP